MLGRTRTALLIVFLAVATAGCAEPDASGGPPGKAAPHAEAPAAPDPRLAAAGAVPGMRVIDLAGTEDGSLFVWAEDPTGASFVIEIDHSGTEVRRSSITAGAQHPQAGYLHGFAVTPQAVWIGAGSTLFSLDRATGRVGSRPLPPVAGSTPGSVEINAVVPSAQRGLVIGLRAAPALLVFNPTTGGFSELRLPDVGDATSVAVLADGTVGAGMANNTTHHFDTVAIFSPSDHRTVATAESILVSAWGAGFLTSGVGATWLGVDGTSAPVDLGTSQGNERLRPAEFADGRVVLLSNDRGLLVLDPATKRVTGAITLGTVECGLGEGSHTGRLDTAVTTAQQSIRCADLPDHITASGSDLVVDLGRRGLLRAAAGTF